jgi:hypothetical protein
MWRSAGERLEILISVKFGDAPRSMLQALNERDAAANLAATTSPPGSPERSQAPGFLARAGRSVLGVFIAHVLLGVDLSANGRRAVEALAVLDLQLFFALQCAFESIDLTLCM